MKLLFGQHRNHVPEEFRTRRVHLGEVQVTLFIIHVYLIEELHLVLKDVARLFFKL